MAFNSQSVRSGLVIFASVFAMLGCQPAAQVNDTASVEALVRNVHVVDFNSDQFPNATAEVLENRTIVVDKGRIVGVFESNSKDIPSAITTIDGQGQYAVAGFTEMHGHVPPAEGFGRFPERYASDMLYLYVANGVTTVRGMLGYPHQLQLKDDIANGSRVGPTLYLAGPSFNGNSIESPEQATQRVIEQRDQGWDLLKIHPGLSLAEYQALATTANNADMDFGGHVPADVGLLNALAAGQRTIDHIDGYLEAVDALQRPITEAELAQLVTLSREAGVAIVPTQALWATLIGAGDSEALRQYPELDLVPAAVRQGWFDYIETPSSSYHAGATAALQQANRQQLLKALYEGGVEIIFGTDAPQLFSVPGFSIHREIPYMSAAGMTNADIIYSATVAAGDYFAEQDLFGRIAPGHRADFMLVPGNPLDDLATLADHQGVMVRGEWLSTDSIAQKLAEIRTAYAAAE